MIILLDMDGVLANLEDTFWDIWEAKGHPVKPHDERDTFYVTEGMTDSQRHEANLILRSEGFYAGLRPMVGAVHGAKLLLSHGHDVRICTAPMKDAPTCASEKVWWIRNWLGPEWLARLNIVPDKTLVRGDIR